MVVKISKQTMLEQQINYYEREIKIAHGHKNQLPKGYVEQLETKINHYKKELNKLKKEK
jgi:phage shock protein A